MFKIELPKFKNILTTTTLVATLVGAPIAVAAADQVIAPEEATVTVHEVVQGPQMRNGAQFRVDRTGVALTNSTGGNARAIPVGSIVTVNSTNATWPGPARISVNVSGFGSGYILLSQFSSMTHIGGPAF